MSTEADLIPITREAWTQIVLQWPGDKFPNPSYLGLRVVDGVVVLENKWILVSERKPPYSFKVLVIDEDIGRGQEIRVGRLLEGKNGYSDGWILDHPIWVNGSVYERVTHWMPLPVLPPLARKLSASQEGEEHG